MVVKFKTPPKKQKVISPEQPSCFDYGVTAGFDSEVTGLLTMSPDYLLEWSRHIVEEVDTRTTQTIQSGKLSFLAGFLWLSFWSVESFFLFLFCFSSLLCIFVGPLSCRFVSVTGVVLGISKLVEKVDDRLGKKRTRKYSSRNDLHKRMLGLHPAFTSFVAGPKNGQVTHFFCEVCKRDVAMKAHGSGEFIRHFGSDGHWYRDVTYRVHMRLPVLNRLLEPMELSDSQIAEYRARPFVDSAEGYPFPEDLIPKHCQIKSRVPFMTLVSCFCDLLRSGGDLILLRRMWGHFCASLGDRKPAYSMQWSRSETVVSIIWLCIGNSSLSYVSEQLLFFLFVPS